MRFFPLLCGIFALAAASSARADDEPSPTALSNVRLDVGTGVLFADKDDASIRRYNVYFVPRLSFHDRVYIAPRMNLSTLDLSLRKPKNLPIDVDLSFPWQMSMGFDLRYRHPLLRWLDLNVFYRFEFPTAGNEAEIGALKSRAKDVDGNAAPALERIKDHISVVHTWRHFELGTTLQANVGWWHPFVDVGYTSTVGRLSVDFEQEATTVLGAAGINPARFYDTSISSITYAAGSEFDLGKGFSIRLRTTVVVLSDSWLVNTDTALVIPLDTAD